MPDLFAFSPTTVLLCVAVLAVLWLLTRRPSGLPPGPLLLPFVGNALSMGSDLRITFKKLRQQYGDIFSVYMLNTPVIVLNGYNTLRDAIVKNAEVFSDRPYSVLTDFMLKGKGVSGTSGELWREQRRFALNTLREFGAGRNIMENKIHEEVSQFLEAFEAERGQGFDCKRLVNNAVSNVVCSTMFGKRFEYTDPLYVTFLKAIDDIFADLGAAAVSNVLPIVRFLPGDLFKFKKTMRNMDTITTLLIDPMIKEHLQNHDDDNVDDFIHAYIKEMRLRKDKQEDTTLDLENLAMTIADLFLAGTETTATTIRWTLAYFLHNPDVQEKCFREIQENIGQSRRPSMKDKTNLPYVEATIMEVLRRADIGPLSLPHTVPHDVQFRGYTFPKGANVILMLDSVLQDPDVWGDPDIFRPGRFLDDTGKIVKKEEFIPFSLGRRVCLGESMARMEMFLFLTTMIQRFKFVPVDGQMPSLDGIFGITNSPKPFLMKAIHRI
ncbi:cytochrome P450 2U1-like [Haliotis rufescens]|uniref:cytochrome P450 2U1-like n=1 Tax=Haliotis rufescens TaxID=6454 RepID=UPI00201EB96C|nr:cytochrome P450 2U1-like [Haliotis rufescens]